MRVFDGIDDGMVTDYTGILPRYCLYCGSRCWQIGDYPYARRCSQCSAYFHQRFMTCDDLVREGYDTYLCAERHGVSALRLFEMVDGRLVEVCRGCADWLYEEGYLDECISCAFDNLDRSI